jgi:hypothetical protein
VIVLAVGAGDQVDQVKHILIVGEAPIPPPDPDILSGLAKKVFDWKIALVPEEQLDKVKDLAQSHEVIASQIAAGALTTPKQILDATVAANQEAIGKENRTAWLPFFQKLAEELDAQQRNGGMVKPEAIQKLWLSIAKGLRSET